VKLETQIDLVNAIIKPYQWMFTQNVTHNPSIDWGNFQKAPDGKHYRRVTWPKGTRKKSSNGLILKDDMGFVTIECRYLKKSEHSVEEVGHSFRYFNTEHAYLCEYLGTYAGEKDFGPSPYSFRYDEDWTSTAQSDPPSHIQVLHNVPRFEIKSGLSLNEFLNAVKTTCFDKATTGIRVPFFANER
jgi:hypothetical protein